MDIKVSMTSFIDYTLRPDSQKLAKVREIKNFKYSPAFDFWKLLRDKIEYINQENKDPIILNKLLSGLDEKKQANYQKAIKGYIKFHTQNDLEYFSPLASTWDYENLSITVNPELGLYINGEPHLVKLYFKEHTSSAEIQLNNSRAEVIAYLMWESFNKDCPPKTKMSILNVAKGQLVTPEIKRKDQRASLQISAYSFLLYWEKA